MDEKPEISAEEDATIEMLALLQLIEENTRQTKEAVRGLGALFIYPIIGLILGGGLILVGFALTAAGGFLLVVLGCVVALALSIAGPIAAFSRLQKTR